MLLMERVMLHSLGFYLTVDHIEEVLWGIYEALIKHKEVESDLFKDLFFVSKTIVRRICFTLNIFSHSLLFAFCLISFRYPFRQLICWLRRFAFNLSH